MRWLAVGLFAIVACSSETTTSRHDAGGMVDADMGLADAGSAPFDASSSTDAEVDAGPEDGGVADDSGMPDFGLLPDAGPAEDTGVLEDAGPPADSGPPRLALTVLTFNTGTSGIATHDSPPDDGYTSVQAQISEDYYGHGLSWVPVMDDTRAFLASVAPDIVAFQEIFYSGDCAAMPPEGVQPGFICDGWVTGQPTVAQQILDANFQVACNLGKPDKCLAVRLSVGSFRGCAQSLCLDGLDGARVQDCGSGSRIGRGIVQLVDGSTLTVVNVHGSSGVLSADQECRERQFEQIFVDLGTGDAQPATNGTRNLVLGDFNTDPVRNLLFDSSARRLEDFAGGSHPFQFITDVGRNADPTYSNLFNIDHVLSDHFVGSCWAAGVTAGHPAATTIEYYDHVPVVCDIQEP